MSVSSPKRQSTKRRFATDCVQELRRAAAAVELAVCLPVIVVLVFGALEGANILFCRQALVEAAYEASKHASRADGTSAHATTLAQDILKARRVNNATITLTPANVSLAKPGQEVSVNIKVSAKERTYTGLGLFDNRTIAVTATMQKD
ncbi:MAG: TadE/TadG family type IV pilus assembly protein [Pirellulales bacterium]